MGAGSCSANNVGDCCCKLEEHTLTYFVHRIFDDYVAVYFGMTLLRTGKILAMVLIIAHVFTCAYWYIKTSFSTQEEIADFLSLRQIEETVPALSHTLFFTK
jgi:hypothetical protein